MSLKSTVKLITLVTNARTDYMHSSIWSHMRLIVTSYMLPCNWTLNVCKT